MAKVVASSPEIHERAIAEARAAIAETHAVMAEHMTDAEIMRGAPSGPPGNIQMRPKYLALQRGKFVYQKSVRQQMGLPLDYGWKRSH